MGPLFYLEMKGLAFHYLRDEIQRRGTQSFSHSRRVQTANAVDGAGHVLNGVDIIFNCLKTHWGKREDIASMEFLLRYFL